MSTCKKCSLYRKAKAQWFTKSKDGEVLFVISSPKNAKQEINFLKKVLDDIDGADTNKISELYALKCDLRNWSEYKQDLTNSFKACSSHLFEEIDQMPNLKKIVALGRDACNLFSTNAKMGSFTPIKYKGIDVYLSYSALYLGHSKLYSKYNFEALFKHVFGAEEKPLNRIVVKTYDQLLDLYEKLNNNKLWAFDIETTGLSFEKDFVIGISFSFDRHEGYYIILKEYAPIFGWSDFEIKKPNGDIVDLVAFCMDVLENESEKIAQNSKFELSRLRTYWGCEIKNLKYDTQVLHYLLNSHIKKHKLETISELYPDFTGYKDTIKGVDFNGRGWETVPTNKIAEYGADDSILTYRYHVDYYPKLSELAKRYAYPLLIDGMALLSEMEYHGVYIDKKEIDRLEDDLNPIIDGISKKFKQKYGVNVGSSDELRSLLFDKDKMSLPTKGIKKSKKGYSTDSTVIEHLVNTVHNEELNDISLYRSAVSTHSKYVKNLASHLTDNGYYRPSWSLTTAVTGRLSSGSEESKGTKVNFQNFPVRTDRFKVRRIVAAPEDYYFIDADYSQIEIRMMAYLTQDPALLEALNNNFDPHSFNAAAILGMTYEDVVSGIKEGNPKYKNARVTAKTVGFAWLYGARRGKFFEQGVFPTLKAEDAAKDNFFNTFQTFLPWKEDNLSFLHEFGYVQGITGRIREFPIIYDKYASKKDIASAEREAINSLVQGPSSDFTLKAAIEYSKLLKQSQINGRVINLIHDAIYAYLHKCHLNEGLRLFEKALLSVPYFGVDVNMGIEVEVSKLWSGDLIKGYKLSSIEYREAA